MYLSRLIRGIAILLLCFISAFLVLIFSWLPKGGVYPFISQKFWGPGLFWLVGAKLKVEGLENIADNQHGIYFANHQSNFDIPALTTTIPEPLYFIAKAEMKKIPIFGWGMASIGMVFVDRKNREKAHRSMEKAAKVVMKGKSLGTFPEGTRSSSGRIQPFKKGTFHLAKNGPIRLIPVAVIGTRNIQPKGGKLQIGQRVTVRIGKPISETEVARMSMTELAKYAQEQIVKLIDENSVADLHAS